MERLAELLAPWHSAFGHSPAVSATVTTVHIVALLFGGGMAIAADRMTLRVTRRSHEVRARHLLELHAVHRSVLIALGVLWTSGLLLAAADVETFYTSWLFWVKLALVSALVVNGAMLTRYERTLRRMEDGPTATPGSVERSWRRLRVAAVFSLTLWTATAIAGAVLGNS